MIEIKIIKTNRTRAFIIRDERPFVFGGEKKRGEVTKAVFGIKQDLIPNSYVDENGKPAGQNIEVYEKIDELLPQYEFEYDAVDADSILLGIDSGKYAGGLGNYFWNESRAEKSCCGRL